MGLLDGKVAVITGAARGQGRAHAMQFARAGADIVAVDVCEQIDTTFYDMPGEAELAETVAMVEGLDRRVVAHKADVRDHEALEAAVDDGVAQLGRLDFAVCNAGISHISPALDITVDQWDEMLDVDLKGVFLTARTVIPHIMDHGDGGAIVMTSSTAGLHAFENLAHYAAAKHGVVGLMRVLAMEFGRHRIRVNTIHPGNINTDMLQNQHAYDLFCPDIENPTAEQFAETARTMQVLPISWLGAEDIANAAVFPCSDEARYITGVSLPVDGGNNLIG